MTRYRTKARRTKARRLTRRTTRRAAAVLTLALVATAPAACGWATSRSLTARAVLWRDADTDDIHRFPARRIASADSAFRFHRLRDSTAHAGYRALTAPVRARADGEVRELSLDEFLESRETLAFLVVRRDTILLERYFGGTDAATLHTTFSVSKSILSAALGAAIDRGHIHGLDQSITEFLPELATRDTRFRDVTLRHLVTMSSGIRFERGKSPWGDEARAYYHPDLRSVALDVRLDDDPGRAFHYNFYNPLLVGLAVERAAGTTVSDLFADAVWTRIGTEHAASWSVDSDKHAFEKMESGFNATARDLARLGRLYLRHGDWNGRQVLPADWTRQSVAADSIRDPAAHYQYFWWVRPVEGQTPHFYAEGRFGQLVYVVPDAGVIIVRLGPGSGGVDWVGTLERLAGRAGS